MTSLNVRVCIFVQTWCSELFQRDFTMFGLFVMGTLWFSAARIQYILCRAEVVWQPAPLVLKSKASSVNRKAYLLVNPNLSSKTESWCLGFTVKWKMNLFSKPVSHCPSVIYSNQQFSAGYLISTRWVTAARSVTWTSYSESSEHEHQWIKHWQSSVY